MDTTDRLPSKDNQLMIREAIRKIALGRSKERVDMSATGTSGVGTARLIHGYVAKIHDTPSDSEYADYGGTIDVGEYPDETASSEPILHKGVLLAGIRDNSGGFLIIPTLFSDVTIVSDAGTKNTYIVNYSHAEIIQLASHNRVKIGVTETEALDTDDENTPDYNALPVTGNESNTEYSAKKIYHYSKDSNGNQSEIEITPDAIRNLAKSTISHEAGENINHKAGSGEMNLSDSLSELKNGSTGVHVQNGKIAIGDNQATEPLVLGMELAQLMLDFINECAMIMTPTMLGTMPAVNAPNFLTLVPKIQNFLSKTAYTK